MLQNTPRGSVRPWRQATASLDSTCTLARPARVGAQIQCPVLPAQLENRSPVLLRGRARIRPLVKHRTPSREILRSQPRVDRERRAHRLGQRPAQCARSGLLNWRQAIVGHPFNGVVGRLPRECGVGDRSQGVDVRPRTLRYCIAVLFDRCVARRQDGGQRLGVLPHLLPGGTEIDEHGGAVASQHHVGRLDVPMEHACLVNGSESFRQGRQHRANFGLPHRSSRRKLLGKALAIQVVHHQVGRALSLHDPVHSDHVGMIEPCQRPRLPNEPPQTPGVVADRRRGSGDHRAVFASHTPIPGKVFLHCHMALQSQIESQVGDSESARTELTTHLEPFEPGAFG